MPGPSAVLTALAVSGLPVDRFCFEGFLARKAGERSRLLAELADERRTMVFARGAAPTRGDAGGDGRGVRTDSPRRRLSRATKTYEEVVAEPCRSSPWARDGVKGEITVVVAGAERKVTTIESELSGIRHRVAQGERLKDVCGGRCRTGLSKKALYDAAVADARASRAER